MGEGKESRSRRRALDDNEIAKRAEALRFALPLSLLLLRSFDSLSTLPEIPFRQVALNGKKIVVCIREHAVLKSGHCSTMVSRMNGST